MNKLLIDERALLVYLYKQHRIPTDQFKRRPVELRAFTNQWNALASRNDEPGELYHYMVSQRKQAKWPRLGKNHKKIDSLPDELLTVDEWGFLRAIYRDMNTGSDNFAFYADLRSELESRFALKAGRLIPGQALCAVIEAKRKRGLWETITTEEERFSDIDEVAM